MPKKAAGLTARGVVALTAPGMFADGGGLYLSVAAAGAKKWIFRFMLRGRRRDMGLGSASVCSLAEAREKAAAARRLVAAGIDPIEARKQEEAAAAVAAARATTFKECAESLIASKRAGWKNAKHQAQWAATLETYAYPTLGALPVAEVDTGLVCKVLEPIWSEKPETASRLRGRIEAVLTYATVRGYRSGENPGRWRGHLAEILPARLAVSRVEHHASLAWADVPSFWPRLQLADGLGARALELTILTACRTSEVLGAAWPEIDLDAKLWTIPAGRMKAGNEHRVPLSDAAVVLLRKLATVRTGDLVFAGPGPRRLSNMVMLQTTRRMKVAAVPHGFRASFRSWAAEATSFPADVAEAALAHSQGSKLLDAYQRGDLLAKRRRLMDAWAGFVTGGGRTTVTQLRRA
ncbi:MAG: integrase arm-type DNA-binding domain-containing protein [Alphaproteobacteria bacterium]|nr:integrase arm-type DNA-binding domain-containing protein [Alphaproteobacteria bacterium]